MLPGRLVRTLNGSRFNNATLVLFDAHRIHTSNALCAGTGVGGGRFAKQIHPRIDGGFGNRPSLGISRPGTSTPNKNKNNNWSPLPSFGIKKNNNNNSNHHHHNNNNRAGGNQFNNFPPRANPNAVGDRSLRSPRPPFAGRTESFPKNRHGSPKHAAIKKPDDGSPPRDEHINSRLITLISLDGEGEGVKSLSQVLHDMDRKTHTLVLVDNSQDPPACRIYERRSYLEKLKATKKQKKLESKKAKSTIIRINALIGDHDFEVKMNKVVGVLEKAGRVNLVIEKRKADAKIIKRTNELADKITEIVKDVSIIVNQPSSDHISWTVALQGKPLRSAEKK